MGLENDAPGEGGGAATGQPTQEQMLQWWLQYLNAGQPGGNFDAFWRQKQAESGAYQSILNALPPNIRQNGIQISPYRWFDPTSRRVYELQPNASGAPAFVERTEGDSKRIMDEYAATGGGASGGGGGSSGGGGTDPAYLALQYAQLSQADRHFVDQLAQDYMNTGLDADAARQQALASLIANRNNTAVSTGQLSLSAAEAMARERANPRDAVSELILRNSVQGSTPFGDMTNDNFGAYGKRLAEVVGNNWAPVSADLNALRNYRDAIPPQEFFGAETRGQLGLPPTPAQQLTGAAPPTVMPAAAGTAAPTNPLAALVGRLQSMTPQEQWDFRNYTTGGQYGQTTPRPMAKGGKLNVEALFDRGGEGFSPASSEGGTNLNIHERAVVVGESGHVYATLGERRPDGTMRAEQLMIKPLKSEVEKDRKLEEGKKAIVESQKKTLAAFDQGGTATATADDFMAQLSQYLGSLGGPGGGTGSYSTPLPSLRLLAGAPAEALFNDPDALAYAQAGYSAQGISPNNFLATLKKYQTAAPINNAVRTSFA